MANKATILSNINGFLTAVITQAKVRSAALETVNELYSDAVTDNQTSETYTTKAGTNINYSLTLKKTGNEPMLKGTLTNNTGGVLSPQNVLLWKDTEYKPKDGLTYLFDAVQGSNKVRCFINNNVLAITSPMLSGIYTIDNFQTYIAQD